MFNVYSASLNALPFPQNRALPITLTCVACDLTTFPNALLAAHYRWQVLDFASSHIKHLRMNVVNATLADKLLRLHLQNNSITHLDEDSLATSYTIFDLDLSFNLIVNVTGVRTINKMQNLIMLNLEHNYITHLDALVFANLTQLDILKLNNNRLLKASFICHLHRS